MSSKSNLTSRPTKTLPPAQAKSKVTPWFPNTIQPVREGDYEVRFSDGSGDLRHWNGSLWVVIRGGAYPSMFNDANGAKWRGLASDPKGKA